MDAERFHRIALSLVPGLGLCGAKQLLDHYGSAQMLFDTDALNQDESLCPTIRSALLQPEIKQNARQEIERCEEKHIQIHCLGDPDYPFRLAECPTAPIVLYSIGHFNLNAEKVVSIVGTRKSTPYCRDLTNQVIKDLADLFPDLVIISGLAYGIDVAAHQAALRYGLATYGVLAHGLQEIYPAPHRNIAKEMLQQGGLVTESIFGTPSHAYRFLKRNRIVAGLCDACVVVESSEKGGSMNTAATARELNRDVFAFSGRATDKNFGGCNLLIKRNLAALIDSAEDLIREMNWVVPDGVKPRQTCLFEAMDPRMSSLLNLLRVDEKTHQDSLAAKTGFRIEEILSMTLQLEMEGWAESLPGGFYRKKMS